MISKIIICRNEEIILLCGNDSPNILIFDGSVLIFFLQTSEE